MAYEFQNGQVVVPTSGCGVSNLPGVAVYNPEVSCPGAGYGASTYATPSTPLKVNLTTPIATFTIASASTARNFFIGSPLSTMCAARVSSEVGGAAIVNICDDGSGAVPNSQASNFCCYLDSNKMAVIGLVLKTSDSPSEINATQVLFDPCNPCFTSSTDFVCANGCNDNSNFILTNAVVGGNAGLVVTIPALVSAKLDICSCATEVPAFANCPISIPAIAQIVSAPVCVPQQVAPSNVAYGNPYFTGTTRQF